MFISAAPCISLQCCYYLYKMEGLKRMNEMRKDPGGKNSIKFPLETLVKYLWEKTRSLPFSSCMTVSCFPLFWNKNYAGPSKKAGAQPLPRMFIVPRRNTNLYVGQKQQLGLHGLWTPRNFAAVIFSMWHSDTRANQSMELGWIFWNYL